MTKDKLDEILMFFDGLSNDDLNEIALSNDPYSLAKNIQINRLNAPLDPAISFELAIIGIIDTDEKATDEQILSAPNAIRKQMYRLARVSSNLRIADLGNIRKGKSLKETFFALQEAIAQLFNQNINVILLGGSQVYTIGCLRAFKEFESDINLVCVDSKLDLNNETETIENHNYLDHLIAEELTHIYNISSFCYQSYFVHQKQLNKFSENYFNAVRLGKARGKMEELEPEFRDADLVSFDISAIREQEAPGQKDGSPNGLYAEEACRLARYAGISDRTRLFGFFNYEPMLDVRQLSAKLIGQIIWYYIEGYRHRKHDYPSHGFSDYIKYSVDIDEIEDPIVFYKSNKTGRWWINVCNMHTEAEKQTSVVVSCLEQDYLKACKNEIPECWWTNFKKLR